MRRWWLVCLVATAALAQEGDGAGGKGEKDPIPALVKQLADGDAKTRARAARALARTGDERATEATRAALADPDATVRAAAAVALVRLDAAGEQVIDVLIASLENPDWYTRWDACVALGSLGAGARRSAPALLAAAADPDLDLGRESVLAVLQVAPGDPQALSGIVALLGSDVAFDRAATLRTLEKAGQIKLARDWLVAELIADRHGLRTLAATMLRKCGIEGATYLQRGLASSDPGTRATALHELSLDELVRPAIFVGMLSDPEPVLRGVAIAVLRDRKVEESAPDIALRLRDDVPGLRLKAARALAALAVEVPEAGPGLVYLVAEGDPERRDAALDAMRVTGFAALAMYLECKAERRAQEPPVWTVRLRVRPSTDPFDKTYDHLIERVADNRNGAALVKALRETLSPGQDEIFLAGLGGATPAVRRTSAALLGYLAEDLAPCIRALEKATKDEDKDVRTAAEAALTRLRAR